jgi:rubrerythrin
MLFCAGTPIVLLAEDLNPLLECLKLKMPKETFRSLPSTNLNVFGPERQRALAILKPIIVYHSPNSIIGGVPVTCSVGSEIVTVRIIAGPREVQVYESFREILQRSRGIHAVLTKIIEGLRRACSPRSFDPAAYLQLVTNLLNQVEIRLREEPEYVPRMVEAKFVEKTIVQALEYVSTPYAKARIRELWEYLSNSEEKDPHECTVCMEVMKDPLITSCGHWFCSECVTGVLDSQLHMCPICRTRTTNKNLIKLIGWQAKTFPTLVPSAIKPDTTVGALQPADEASEVNSSAGAVAVDADTPSKLIYLRRKLMSWLDTDDKIVIFSEFQGCLNSVVELANSMGINAAVLPSFFTACILHLFANPIARYSTIL